jgi:glycosyltransferase involved in cell wall biosynthesis
VKPLLTWERRRPESDVLIVTNMWPDTERPVYGIFVKRQVDSLITAGVECDVLYVRGHRTPLAYLWGMLWFALSSVRLRARYRVIHAHAGETAIVARFHLGLPVLISYCGDDLLGNPAEGGGLTLQSRARAFLIRHHSRLMSATITKSAEMERALPPSVQERNVVLPHGVDRNTFHTIPREQARRELGWGQDELVVLFAATRPWITRKRQGLASDACNVAAGELGREVRLEVVATRPPEQMPLLMSAADCLLMTSSIEGSPNAVKEALACGLPVVATPAGDIELLLDGVSSSYVCDSDPREVGDALWRCLTKRQRSNGREMTRWLSEEAIAERLIAIYRSLAPGLASASSMRSHTPKGIVSQRAGD